MLLLLFPTFFVIVVYSLIYCDEPYREGDGSIKFSASGSFTNHQWKSSVGMAQRTDVNMYPNNSTSVFPLNCSLKTILFIHGQVTFFYIFYDG